MAVVSGPPKFLSSTGLPNCQAPLIATSSLKQLIISAGRNIIGYHVNPPVSASSNTVGYPL